MINVNNVSYTVIVITEKKLQLNITQAVEELGWEENEDELAMKIHFNMYNALYNKERLSSLVKINSVVVVKAYWGSGKGIVAMGNIVECERKVSKSDDVFNVVAYDNLFNLQKSNGNIGFRSALLSYARTGQFKDCRQCERFKGVYFRSDRVEGEKMVLLVRG